MSTVNLVNDMRSIYNTKIAIKDALGAESDVFADYPGYIIDYNTRLSYVEEHKADIEDIPSLEGYATEAYVSTAIANAQISGDGDIDLSYYVTKDELSAQSYITMGDVSACGYITQHQDLSDYAQKSYVVDYVTTYAPTPDLSGYVSKSELSSCSYITLNDIPSVDLSSYVSYDYAYENYVSYSYLGSVEELVEYIIGTGSGSAPENIYATKAELSSYATKVELASYVSYSYLEEALSEIDVDIDLSSYVTKDELSAQSYLISHQSLEGYATEQYVDNAIGDIVFPTTDLSSYVTKDELNAQSYLTQHQDLSGYVSKTELSNAGYITSHQSLNGYATEQYVDNAINAIPSVDLSSYVSKSELSAQSYLTSHQDISGLVSKTELSNAGYITMGDVSACGYITANDIPTVDLSSYVTYDFLSSQAYLTQHQDISGLVTKTELSNAGYLTSHQSLNGYATEQYVDNAIDAIPAVDLSGYVTKSELSAQSYLTSHQDLSGYVSKSELSAQSYLTSIPSEYITQTELSSCGYITANDVDLSDYVTYSYAYNTFVSYSYLGDIEEITEYILGSGSSSAPENIYATKSELNSYVSKTSLQNMAYITMDDIDTCGYITASDISIPVIDENLIPNTTATYTLGDSTHLYSATYSSNIYLSDKNGWENVSTWQTRFKLDGNTKYYLTSNRFYPGTNESASLGLSNQRFLDTYTTNLYANTAYLQDTSYSSSIVPKETATYTLGDSSHLYAATYSSQLNVGNNSKVYNDSGGITFSINSNNGIRIGSSAIYPKTSEGFNNGSSSNKWANTYTTNIYTDNISYTSGKSKILMNDRNVDIYANNKKLINVSDYNGVVPIQTNVNLGASSNKWATTYTADLYADTIHNFIWTGTSSEYAALDNYTSYQIYMIKES